MDLMKDRPPAPIPDLTLKEGVVKEKIDAAAICRDWIAKLQATLQERAFDDLSGLFADDCWWRDIVCLSWDFTSKRGQDAIRQYLHSSESLSGLEVIEDGGLKPIFIELGGASWIQTGFTFRTTHGSGKGLVRLINVSATEWKAWVVFSQLERFNYQDAIDAARMRTPSESVRLAGAAMEANGVNGGATDEGLPVLIIGAGQAGLSLGARLKDLGIRSLLVDKIARLGDSWRARYKIVTMHTPKWTDHLPHMRIPDSWPQYLGRDQVADYVEHWSHLMGLDTLLNTEVVSVRYDVAQRRYTVETTSTGATRVLTARHVVLATGSFSEDIKIPDFVGKDSFKGQMYHSKHHVSAEAIDNVRDKKVVVIGTATSGHDIAEDFVLAGAKEVSMIQRHATFVVSSESFSGIQLGLWNMPGLSTEEADLVGNSIPLAVIRTMSIDTTKFMAANDKILLDGLRGAGMQIKTGEDGIGLADHQLIKGGHFYIDQGASQMIVDGKIKLHHCEQGVREIHSNGIVLADGVEIDADVIVFATGYSLNIGNVERIMGKEIADRLPEFGLLDAEQERAGWWRATGVPGFWYMTGSFMWCRQFSLPLALQIAAVEKGFNRSHYPL